MTNIAELSNEMQVGDLKIHATATGLTIDDLRRPGHSFEIDFAAAREMVTFITAHADCDIDRRRSFRIPLYDEPGVQVLAEFDGKSTSLLARDISLTGVYVEQPQAGDCVLSAGDNLSITISYDGITETVNGVVRRTDDCGLGIFFPDSLSGEQLDPPRGLFQIVSRLEQRWIRRNTRS